MQERTNALCRYIFENVDPARYDLIVVDNGSDITLPSCYTAVMLGKNVQTTNAWLMGLHYVDSLAALSGTPYFAYWFLITSAEFPDKGGDPLSPMLSFLESRYDAVGIHPALTQDSTTHWSHMISRGGEQPRQTWMIDNIASLYRADWFNSVGRFDPRLTYAWGIDLETCWKARAAEKTLWIDERSQVKKVTDIGYTMNRMNMTAHDRAVRATDNMNRVLTERYGYDFMNRMLKEFRTNDLE